MVELKRIRCRRGRDGQILDDGVDRDSGGESGRRATAGRDILFLCLSRLEPRVPVHLLCPDPPRLTVDEEVARERRMRKEDEKGERKEDKKEEEEDEDEKEVEDEKGG